MCAGAHTAGTGSQMDAKRGTDFLGAASAAGEKPWVAWQRASSTKIGEQTPRQVWTSTNKNASRSSAGLRILPGCNRGLRLCRCYFLVPRTAPTALTGLTQPTRVRVIRVVRKTKSAGIAVWGQRHGQRQCPWSAHSERTLRTAARAPLRSQLKTREGGRNLPGPPFTVGYRLHVTHG